MGTKADLRANEWIIKFNVSGSPVIDIWEGKTAKEALDAFQAVVMVDEWHDFHGSNNEILRVRTSWIGAMEAYR